MVLNLRNSTLQQGFSGKLQERRPVLQLRTAQYLLGAMLAGGGREQHGARPLVLPELGGQRRPHDAQLGGLPVWAHQLRAPPLRAATQPRRLLWARCLLDVLHEGVQVLSGQYDIEVGKGPVYALHVCSAAEHQQTHMLFDGEPQLRRITETPTCTRAAASGCGLPTNLWAW